MVWISIFITCFVVYFLYSDMFGIYSDDQFFIAVYNNGYAMKTLISNAVYSGRPIGFLSMSLLYPLFMIGGLSLAYVGMSLILSLESMLVFIFFRMFLPWTPSFCLALVYLLFPADTGKFLFVNVLFAHASAIIFWTSAILYEKRKPIFAAICAVVTMLIYETHLTQAVFIPIIVFILSCFSEERGRTWRQELRPAAAFLLSFGIFGGLLLLGRLLLAPGRLPSSLPGGAVETAEHLFSAGLLGIGAVILSHAYRFNTLLSNPSFGVYVVLVSLLIFNVVLWRTWKPSVSLSNNKNVSASNKNVSAFRLRIWSTILLIAGVVVMYASYLPFALEAERWPPTPINGRASSVHLGASVGYVLIWAGFFQWMSVERRRAGLVLSVTMFLLYSFVMGGFFLLYQEKLVQNWQMQTVYWRQIEECLREATPKLIIVDAEEEEQRAGPGEPIFDWTTPYVPYLQAHNVRPAGQWPLVQTRSLLEGKAQLTGDKLKLSSLFTWFIFPTDVELSLSDIMLVKPLGGALVRPPEPIRVGSSTLSPRQICYTALASVSNNQGG
jgi:hypothetical protein